MICEICKCKIGNEEIKIDRLSTSIIIERFCDFNKVTPHQLLSNSRKSKFVELRHIISYILRADGHLNLSLKAIGCLLNNRDHTTIMHSISKVHDYMSYDDNYKQSVKNNFTYIYGHNYYF